MTWRQVAVVRATQRQTWTARSAFARRGTCQRRVANKVRAKPRIDVIAVLLTGVTRNGR